MRHAKLIALFLTLETISLLISRKMSARIDFESITTLVVVLIALPFASSLAARAVSYLDIFSWLRAPFTVVTPHSAGVGDSVDPKNGSVLGSLMSCINCSGMWSTVLLLALYALEPCLGAFNIVALGATSIGILLTRTIEMVEWKSCLAQERTGQMNRINKYEQLPTPETTYFEEQKCQSQPGLQSSTQSR